MKSQNKRIGRIGLVANPEKKRVGDLVKEAARLIRVHGGEALVDAETARIAALDLESKPGVEALAQATDLLVIFGGDGTMLRVARKVGDTQTPLLGINVGGLGFLTAVSSDELAEALEKVWAGAFTVEEQPLLQAVIEVKNGRIQEEAVNEFVIGRGILSRLIELEVAIDHEPLTTYRGDGLIISTPIGSTAYSLAAGGAVVSPAAQVMTLTPICPHTLSNRSVIVSLTAIVRVKALSAVPETLLTADGQIQHPLGQGAVVTITRSARAARLIRLTGTSFFETLRRKFHWSGSHVAYPEPSDGR